MRSTPGVRLLLAPLLALLVVATLFSAVPAQATTSPPTSVTASTAASGAAATPTRAKDRYRPKSGPMFNNPFGTTKEKDRLMVHVRRAIKHAPKHSVVRIALYSFNRADLATAIINACQRKVSVQMVLNDNTITKQMIRVRKVLGTNRHPHMSDGCHPRDPKQAKKPYATPSFFKICTWSCRVGNGVGNQHIKFYLFSKTGRAKNVVMLGSNNLTTYAAHTHWNDLFTVSEQPQMFADYSEIFAELAKDKRVPEPYRVFIEGPYVSEFGAKRQSRGKHDPVIQRLGAVGCKAPQGYGEHGRTVIRVTMYAWVFSRGIQIAEKMADLRRRGCIVRTILSGPGARMVGVLRRAGVKMRSADLNLDHNLETGFDETPWEKFTHEKWMSVDGTFNGAPTRAVWTGSENWSNKSLKNDEVTMMIPYERAFKLYTQHFEFVWRAHTRPVGFRYAQLMGLDIPVRSDLE